MYIISIYIIYENILEYENIHSVPSLPACLLVKNLLPWPVEVWRREVHITEEPSVPAVNSE